ncbi:hypothetical protein HHK36_006550 [Tetracentron sinense]|uniref:DUF4408 domain-containing protein n=1 Tax=Tetracentron sinense TaxID=13715 RepID=A0A835DP96_TETSI|nr:hypothetical protein HHK36_006550 [Tetracentron sinense]
MAVWCIKLAFLSIGIISTVLLLKIAIPYCVNLLSTLPRILISFQSWLSPPYLYIIVNFIIISIAASSTFQQKLSEKKENEAENLAHQKKQEDPIASDSSSQYMKKSPEIWTEMNETPPESGEKSVISVEKSVKSPPESDEKQEPNLLASGPHIRRSNRKTLRSTAAASDKPLKSLGVAKPKKQSDTLDATWKAISEGQGLGLTRQLKKSDTWNVPRGVNIADTEEEGSARRELRKSETFNEAAASRNSSVGGGMRRENSTSRDELNRRVEAFIKKFNNEIRLQRQESNERYMEMVNRGVY